MFYHKTIRSVIALFLMVVFAFSISSQKAVHDLVAKHSDQVKCEVHKSVPIDQVENSGIHCTQDNLISNTPFANFSFNIHLQHPVIAQTRNTVMLSFYFSSQSFSTESRGPPNA